MSYPYRLISWRSHDYFRLLLCDKVNFLYVPHAVSKNKTILSAESDRYPKREVAQCYIHRDQMQQNRCPPGWWPGLLLQGQNCLGQMLLMGPQFLLGISGRHPATPRPSMYLLIKAEPRIFIALTV